MYTDKHSSRQMAFKGVFKQKYNRITSSLFYTGCSTESKWRILHVPLNPQNVFQIPLNYFPVTSYNPEGGGRKGEEGGGEEGGGEEGGGEEGGFFAPELNVIRCNSFKGLFLEHL